MPGIFESFLNLRVPKVEGKLVHPSTSNPSANYGFLSRFWNRCGPNFSHAGAAMAQPCMALYHQPCLAMKHGTLKGCRRHSLAGHQEEAKNCCKALALAADGQMPFWGHELQAIWYGRLWQGGSTPVSSKALSYMQAHPKRH